MHLENRFALGKTGNGPIDAMLRHPAVEEATAILATKIAAAMKDPVQEPYFHWRCDLGEGYMLHVVVTKNNIDGVGLATHATSCVSTPGNGNVKVPLEVHTLH